MASFPAKIGWKRLTRRGNKNYRSVSFLTKAKQKIPKKQQKNSKIRKYHYGVISSQNRLEKAQREKIKIIVPFPSYPTRKRKLKKNTKKIE